MDHQFCPGSKLLRQPAPEMFSCPSCGEEVEIWTDEFKADCPKCSRTILRDATMSCLDWCKYGQDCVGDTIYANYMRNKAIGVKQKLLEILQEYFGEDRKRISHAERVLDFAEELLEEGCGEWHIVVPASILHDVGIKSAEEKYGSSAADLQEKEGPPVARDILMKLGFRIEDTDQICEIIAHHHHPGVLDTQNFKTVYDSDCVANMQESAGKRTEEQLKTTIDNVLLTPAGKKLAARRLVERSADIPKSRRTVQ